MIFNTLGRYFFWRYAKTLFWFVLGVIAIIFLVDFSENSGRLASVQEANAASIFWLTLIRLPLILQQTIPFVTLFSGMIALISLNRRYELVVTRAAGISVWQFMAPFALGAFLTGILSVTVLNPLAANGMRAALNYEASVQATSETTSLHVPWLHQVSQGDEVIIGASQVLDDGTLLAGVVMIHFDPAGNIVLRQDARTAKLEDGYWLLNDVSENAPGAIPKHVDTARVSTNLKQEFVQESLSQAETIAFFDLPRKIAAAKSFGVSSKSLEMQFHSLLSQPVLLVAMMLIAGTVSLKFSRFAQSRTLILGGILSGFMLYVVTALVKAFGSSGVVPPFVAAWIPVVVATALGATILLHQEDG